MDQPKYRIEIFWSDEDDGFIADVPDLRYCSAFGQIYEEALREVLVAMELHLDALRELGRPIPEPKSRRVVGVRADMSDPGGTVQIVEEVEVSSVDDIGEVADQLADAASHIVEDIGAGAGELVGGGLDPASPPDPAADLDQALDPTADLDDLGELDPSGGLGDLGDVGDPQRRQRHNH